LKNLAPKISLCLVCIGLLRLAQPADARAQSANPPHAASTGRGAASLKWRIFEPWLDPARNRGYWTHSDENLLNWDTMLHAAPSTALGQLIEQVRLWGYNVFSLPARMDVDAHPDCVAALCVYLKSRGLIMLIHRDWNEPSLGAGFKPSVDTDGLPRGSPLFSPYNPDVRAYWQKRIARDYELVPGLGGYRMDGGEYNHINGAPWMGEGPETQGKTGAETVRDALKLVAGELGKHQGTLFWRDCEDDPWGSRDEVWYFNGMTGKIPANALILIKDYYWDYQPDWPVHPLDLAITKDAKGRSPYLTTIQLPGEYTGTNDFPWSQVEHISQALKTALATGQPGFWVAALPLNHAPWDHPLNMVNWYAVAELMKNPAADPEELKLAWAKSEYGDAAAATIVEILKQTTAAARGMYTVDGLTNACHSRFPGLAYLDSHMCGPMRQTRRMTGMIGMTLPLDMYPAEVAAEIRENRGTWLVFNQVPITPAFKAHAMAEKEGAITSIREATALLQSLHGKIDEARYTELLTGLQANLNDTIAFRDMMELFLDWKLGTVTEAQIAAIEAAAAGLKGATVPWLLDPHPKKMTNAAAASLKTFIEDLRRELAHPWIEKYWRDNPTGVMGNPPPAK